MFRSVRWPLVLSYLLLILVCLGTLGGHLLDSVRNRALDGAVAELRARAAAGEGERIGPDGILGGRYLGGQPEIREALAGRPGVAVRGLGPQVFWREAADPTLHLAMPRPGGAVYLTRPLTDVQALMLALEENLYRAALLAVAVAGLLALLLARLLTAPLARLTAAARRLASGRLEERIPVQSRDEIGTLGEAFNEMAASLQRQQETLLQFVSDASHELKTPLTSMKALTEVLEGGALRKPDKAERMLRHLRQETDRLDRLVRDLMQLHRLEAGALTLDPRPVDLRELALECGVEVVGESVTVVADPDRLRQVLLNLVDNARRATAEVTEPRITVVVGPGPRLAIEDNGVGLAPEDLERVFERFYRADSARSRGDGGAGLGLAISRRIVEAHGATLRAEPSPGGGARFVVRWA